MWNSSADGNEPISKALPHPNSPKDDANESINNMLADLKSNKYSCYELLIKADKNSLVPTLLALRKYFDNPILSGSVEKQEEYCSIAFNSENTYFASLLEETFRRVDDTVDIATDRLNTLASFFSGQKNELPDAELNRLLQSLKALSVHEGTDASKLHRKLKLDEFMKTHAIHNKIFNLDILKLFEPILDPETVLSEASKSLAGYTTSKLLTENEVTYIAWAKTAEALRCSKQDIKAASKMPVIRSIQLYPSSYSEEIKDYLLLPQNLKSVLEALHTVCVSNKPAFLICSDGAHWATLELVADPTNGKNLHILEFNSNLGNMLGTRSTHEDGKKFGTGFIAKLHRMIFDTNLFETVNSTYKFDESVQYDNNCGVASGAFIYVATDLLEKNKGASIEEIKRKLKEGYKKVINPDTLKKDTEEAVKSARSYILKFHQEMLRFQYDRSKLLVDTLDFGGQRYKLYHDLKNIMDCVKAKGDSETTNGSLVNYLLYSCYTILIMPITLIGSIISYILDIPFRIKCIYSEESLKNKAQEYYDSFIKEVDFPVDKVFSEDLKGLINTNPAHSKAH